MLILFLACHRTECARVPGLNSGSKKTDGTESRAGLQELVPVGGNVPNVLMEDFAVRLG